MLLTDPTISLHVNGCLGSMNKRNQAFDFFADQHCGIITWVVPKTNEVQGKGSGAMNKIPVV